MSFHYICSLTSLKKNSCHGMILLPNDKEKMNFRVGLGRKFGTTAAGEESQVFLEAWFCFEWNVGVPPFSLHVEGGSGTPRLVVSVLSAG